LQSKLCPIDWWRKGTVCWTAKVWVSSPQINDTNLWGDGDRLRTFPKQECTKCVHWDTRPVRTPKQQR
jgi:hypothetical protein